MKLIYGQWQKTRDVDHHETGLSARREREAASLKLSATAKLMGVSAAYLHDLEHGHRAWNVKLVDKFNAAVGQMKGV